MTTLQQLLALNVAVVAHSVSPQEKSFLSTVSCKTPSLSPRRFDMDFIAHTFLFLFSLFGVQLHDAYMERKQRLFALLSFIEIEITVYKSVYSGTIRWSD